MTNYFHFGPMIYGQEGMALGSQCPECDWTPMDAVRIFRHDPGGNHVRDGVRIMVRLTCPMCKFTTTVREEE